MPEVIDRVRDFIREEGLPPRGDRVLVALSGGMDSVALLCILHELGYQLSAAHCNFGLRAEAAQEESFVQQLAQGMGIPLFLRRFGEQDFQSHPGETIQQVARKLRYAFFEELMARLGIDHCATGHHADDQTETLVMSFFRGNGPRLLHGIPLRRGSYFRPLLCLGKQDIAAWLTARNQPWRHDQSNDASDYQRNGVRNQLIPVVEQLYPGFRERFQAHASRHQAQWALLEAIFQPIVAQVVTQHPHGQVVSMHAFGKCMDSVHFPVFLDWWLLGEGYSGTEINSIQRLGAAHTGAIYSCKRAHVLRDREGLWFRPHPQSVLPTEMVLGEEAMTGLGFDFLGFSICIQRQASLPHLAIVPSVEEHWLDMEKVCLPLTVRLWRKGDRIAPLGMKGSKKVSDVLIDQKRSQFLKEQAWVLEDQEGIVLLQGYRIAQRVAIGPATRECLRVQVMPSV